VKSIRTDSWNPCWESFICEFCGYLGVKGCQRLVMGLDKNCFDPGQVSHFWFGSGFEKIPLKIKNSLRLKKFLWVGSKSTQIKAWPATYLLWVKSMLGSGQCPFLPEIPGSKFHDLRSSARCHDYKATASPFWLQNTTDKYFLFISSFHFKGK